MEASNFIPDLETLHPVVNGGFLPVNPRERFRCLSSASFSIPDSDFFRLKNLLANKETDFLESPEGKIYVLCYVSRGCGLSQVVSSMAEKVRVRKQASKQSRAAS